MFFSKWNWEGPIWSDCISKVQIQRANQLLLPWKDQTKNMDKPQLSNYAVKMVAHGHQQATGVKLKSKGRK